MTTYDPGSIGAFAENVNAGAVDPATADDAPVLSTLDELRAALGEAEAVAEQEFEPYALFSPGEVIRVLCSTDLEQTDLKRLQMAAIPKPYRGGRRGVPDVRKMNEAQAFANIIGEQALEVALRQADGRYLPLATRRDIESPFEDPMVLAAFGVAEAGLAIRRIFVKDPYLIRAGQDLLDACGYGERKPGEPGEDEDPT
jgi:hypothetical protein